MPSWWRVRGLACVADGIVNARKGLAEELSGRAEDRNDAHAPRGQNYHACRKIPPTKKATFRHSLHSTKGKITLAFQYFTNQIGSTFDHKWEWKDKKPNAPPSHSRYSTCVQLTRECRASVDVPVEITKKQISNFGEKNSMNEIFKLLCGLSTFKLCNVFTGIVLLFFSYSMPPRSVLHVSNKVCMLC